jgi:hypothetical protein
LRPELVGKAVVFSGFRQAKPFDFEDWQARLFPAKHKTQGAGDEQVDEGGDRVRKGVDFDWLDRLWRR